MKDKFSKTFCVQPWLHQMVTSGGEAGFCCVATPPNLFAEDGRALSLVDGDFERAWNSAAMRSIRKDMAEGRQVKGCERCYLQEAHGKTSHRQHHNAEWSQKIGEEEILRRLDESARAEHRLSSGPVYLHLCLGNLCNLKCRMCNPHNSSMIHKEWRELDEGGAYSRFWAEHGCGDAEIGPWHESEPFWRSVERLIPNLKKVYMTGGEPTLIEGNYRFMRRCVEAGRAGDIELMFNINATKVSDEFIDLIGRFGLTLVNLSLDGVGVVGEYIRYPSRWDAVRSNVTKLLERSGPAVHFGVTPVAQIYNILDLAPLFEHLLALERQFDRAIRIDLIDCIHPLFLTVEILPRSIKSEAIARLERFLRGPMGPEAKQDPVHAQVLRNGIEGLIRRLQADAPADSPRQLEAFAYYTRTLDAHRKQDLAGACPDLAKMLQGERCF